MFRYLGILLVVVLLAPAAATAHTNSVETNPEQGATLDTLPAQATITFSEEPKHVDVVLAKPGGKTDVLTPRVADSTVTVDLPGDGARGTYRLSYRVVSADGHPVSGSVTFAVTAGSAPDRTPAPEPAPVDSDAAGHRPPGSFPRLVVAGGVVLGVVILGFILWRRRP